MHLSTATRLLVGGSIFTPASGDFMENIDAVDNHVYPGMFRVHGYVNGVPRWTTVDFR